MLKDCTEEKTGTNVSEQNALVSQQQRSQMSQVWKTCLN